MDVSSYFSKIVHAFARQGFREEDFSFPYADFYAHTEEENGKVAIRIAQKTTRYFYSHNGNIAELIWDTGKNRLSVYCHHEATEDTVRNEFLRWYPDITITVHKGRDRYYNQPIIHSK